MHANNTGSLFAELSVECFVQKGMHDLIIKRRRIAIVGDWDGDGSDEPGLYRDANASHNSQARR